MTIRVNPSWVSAFPLLSALALLSGCAAAPQWGGPVSGKVEYEGVPVPSGAVTFQAANGMAANAEIMDGKYTIERPPFGECIVTVLTVPDAAGGAVPKFDPADAPADGVVKPRGKYLAIPDRYALAKSSDLRFTVTKDPQTYDVKMKR